MPNIKQPRKKSNVSAKRSFKPKKSTTKKPKFRQAYGTSKLEAYFAAVFLDKLGLKYIYEYEATDIRRFYDFAIVAVPSENEVVYEEKHGVRCVDRIRTNCRPLFFIEVDGSYHHSDPRVVDESKLNPMQKHNKFVDRLKNEWCVKHKIPLLRIWEYDIRNNPKSVMEELESILETLSKAERVKAGLHRPHWKR